MKTKVATKKPASRRVRPQSFPVIVHAEKTNGYWVECVGLEGCYSQGKTIDEALKNAKEAIVLCLEESPKRHVPNHDISLHFVSA